MIKARSNFHSIWRRTSPLRVLQFYVFSQLAVSFVYIYFFCKYTNSSRRLILLHLPVVAGLLAFLLILTGLPLLSERLRNRRLTRYGIALIYAAWSATILLLYVVDFVANRSWGNNVNYQLVSQYLIRRDLFANSNLFLSPRIYLSLAAGLVFILVVHLALSKHIFRGLRQLFSRDQPLSLFRNRRIKNTCAGFGLLLIGYGAYVYALAVNTHESWPSDQEPITGFFRPDLFNVYQDALTERLRKEEPQIRAAYPSKQSFEKKNVIFIIADSLRADHMQVYGYPRPTTPFLNSLWQSGQLRKVEFATSTCAETNCGILSTLSSKNFRGLIPEDFKIHDLLHDQGYNTYFILSGNHDWYGLKKSYGTELTYYFDSVDSKKYSQISDDRSIFEGLENVPDFSDTPAFFYFHLMSTHFLGIKQDRYRIYQPSTIERDWDTFVEGKYDTTALINNYDNGIVQADAMIQQIFDRLREKGYLENSLVVILADHGEGLGERAVEGYGHGPLYQERIRIPLLIYDDSKTVYANLKYATQIDIAPTIIERLGLPVPASWQGQSLLSPDSRQYEFHQTKFRNPSYAVLFRTNETVYKYLFEKRNGREELYELNSDPHETHNLMPVADPLLIKGMKAKLEEYLAEH
ncbi:MAG: sulfatase [Pyrinomonadaceae bacterium]